MHRMFRGLTISFIALLSLFFASEAFAQFATRNINIGSMGALLTQSQRQQSVINYFNGHNIPLTPGVKVQVVWTLDSTLSKYTIDPNGDPKESLAPIYIERIVRDSAEGRTSSCSGSNTRIDEYGWWQHWTVTSTQLSSGSTYFTDYITVVQVPLCGNNYSPVQ